MGKKILITGGAGFIGSHVVRLFLRDHPGYEIVNLDALTYAGNLENLNDVDQDPRYRFIKGDISDEVFVNRLFESERFDGVIHLAAESHVDRSILDPLAFVKTNVLGTGVLLNAARNSWKHDHGQRFLHVSTDEVFGSLGETGLFTERSPYDPRSPYSASKAASDHLVRAYHHTYGLPVLLSNCSNNYGSHQFPEKLIPLLIRNVLQGSPLPVYGKGENVRDWLWVDDHARAISTIFHSGRIGESYNIGGFNEWRNIDLVNLLCGIMDRKLDRPAGHSAKLITHVTDRAGHDMRYAIDATKITTELGWRPSVTFEEGLERTVQWYLDHQHWVDHVTSGAYREYYQVQYGGR